jgi:DNA-binding HxlR family transcriptional regulator
MTQASILTANGCSVRKTLDALGPLSSLLVLRDAAEGVRRFEDFVTSTGLNEATVASRLKRLLSLGILVKTPYVEAGQRPRDEYVFTAVGYELVPVIVALMQWGDRYRPDGGPMRAVDRTTGDGVTLRYVSDTGRVVSEQDVIVVGEHLTD